jgi:hypothetical protein
MAAKGSMIARLRPYAAPIIALAVVVLLILLRGVTVYFCGPVTFNIR